MSSRKPPFLEARELKKIYINGENRVQALHSASLKLSEGDSVAIFGPSGSGKSTFLHLLGGLDRPTSGTVLFKGSDIFQAGDAELARFRNKEVGFVFQFHHLCPEFSALENVALPLLVAGASKEDAFGRAHQIMEEVGLSQRTDFAPFKLSGGEKQRVAVARALVQEPSMVLADEPTGNLDVHTEEGILQMFSELNRKLRITFVIVTHNPKIKKFTKRHYQLVDGRL